VKITSLSNHKPGILNNYTASNVDLMVVNICLLAPLTRRKYTQFATFKSPIDVVNFSNTIQLSPKYNIVTNVGNINQLHPLCIKEQKKTTKCF
jgi:hypothetical protein